MTTQPAGEHHTGTLALSGQGNAPDPGRIPASPEGHGMTGNVETVVHRVLAQHAPYEMCAECPVADRVRIQVARAIDPDAFDEGRPRSKSNAAVIQWAARRHMAQESADRVLGPILEAVDLCWKATPYGSTADDDTAAYILPKGVVHRLVGALQGIGVSASLRAIQAPGEDRA